MGDELIFQDPATTLTRWAGILADPGATAGDVLTVQSDGTIAAAAGGGIPDSWLAADSGGPVTVTTDPVSWVLDGSAGTDIAIDGVDATTINIVTSGVYTVLFQWTVQGDATGAGTAACGNFGGGIFTHDWPNVFDYSCNLFETVTPPSYFVGRSILYPAITVTAPDTIQGSINITASAGTITVHALAILVRRLA